MALIPGPTQISPSCRPAAAHLLRQYCWRRYVVCAKQLNMESAPNGEIDRSGLAAAADRSTIGRARNSKLVRTKESSQNSECLFDPPLTRLLLSPLFFQNAEFGDMSDLMTTTMPGKNEEPLKRPSPPLSQSPAHPNANVQELCLRNGP